MYHVLAVTSAAVARICTRRLIVIAGAYATTTCDFVLAKFEEGAEELARIIDSNTPFGPKPMESVPSSMGMCQCVSEDVLPASDQHLYGFEANGNAVEKRPHHKDFLSDGAN